MATKDHAAVKGAHSCMRFMSIDTQHNLLSIQHKNVTKRFNQCVMFFLIFFEF